MALAAQALLRSNLYVAMTDDKVIMKIGPKGDLGTLGLAYSGLDCAVWEKKYERVAYLDTDVGQPEFTAPGFLSLTVVDKSSLGTSYGCF
ncbi:unnamed protein product [Arabis nemorensis]|uniref:alpha-amylase n=1 Tax=Arabis nemorensis TaxID=586526 RepID=A0A565CIS3_9BRAS|nr:unnamed protein product [Arabis nemorensis]